MIGCSFTLPGLYIAMHVAERGSHGEAIAHLGELSVGQRHVFGLGIELGTIHAGIVHAVFLATGDAKFDLERHTHLAHPFQIALADLDVLLQRLFRQIEHVRAVERLAMHLEILLAGVEQPIDPRQQFLGRVVGMQNDRRAVEFGHLVDMVGTRDRAGDAGALAGIVHALAGKELCAPFENWMIAGEFSSLAASMTAFTVLVLMTFTAGRANFFALAKAKTAWQASPVATPALILLALMIASPDSVDGG